MPDADLVRARTAMDLPAAQATPDFLKDRSHDVRLYTPLFVELCQHVRQMNKAISRLAAELYVFEGDFLELKPAAAAALPPTPLVASINTAKGSRFFHLPLLSPAQADLLGRRPAEVEESSHSAGVQGGQSHSRLQLAQWDKYEQLAYREQQDAGASLCNPGFTPLTVWEDKVNRRL
jgi:hypothetical protein